MQEKKSFIRHFIKERKMVGALAPSSRFLAHKMLKRIDFGQAQVIVELGPGTGVFTKRILKKMRPDGKLLVFELNDSFYEQLKKRFSDERLVLIHDSAEHIEKYLEKYQLPNADVVISSLPLANFPKELRSSILSASHRSLTNTGQYIQFQYSLQSRKFIKRTFGKMNIDFTPLNLPPAFVYTCKKDLQGSCLRTGRNARYMS
jgi:phosphatidylethanolamine/phosphatidyl-N-methylethanolamine N-methyltransferase